MREKVKNDYYVYVYLDPRKPGNFKYGYYEFDYEPFYVGKGLRDRYKKHLCDYEIKRNPLKGNIIKKIINETNQNPIIIKYKEKLSEIKSLKLEIKMIKIIGRRDLKNGPLSNMTDGGEFGATGRVCSDKTKKKMSKSKTGIKNYWYGKSKPIEIREKISNTLSGTVLPEETKRKISETMMGQRHGELNPLNKFHYILSNDENYWDYFNPRERMCIITRFNRNNNKPIIYENITIMRILK